MDREEIVFSFEYDLFDQSMLAALLYMLHCMEVPAEMVGKLSWIIVTEVEGITDFRGLGQLTPEQLAGLWPLRRSIAAEELAAGARAWEAYCADGAAPIQAWLDRDGAVLPVMAEALRFQLKRIPSEEANAIGIVEQETLQTLYAEKEPVTPDKLFGRVSAALPMLGMGDLSYWSVLNRMATGERPLISIVGEAPLPSFAAVHPIEWSNWHIHANTLEK